MGAKPDKICAIACSKPMEDVLEVYQTPYNPLRPVVCIDETNKQLIKEERIPCEPGNPEKVDSVYIRNGVANEHIF